MRVYTILVVNYKGGCGKTTIATNVASYFTSIGKNTVIYDFDKQRSSMRWLERRSNKLQVIEGVTGWSRRRFSPDIECVVMDAPAQLERQDLLHLISRADKVIIPVLPSPIDIDAAADFIGTLLLHGKISNRSESVCVVANRVKANTLVFGRLLKFLKTLNIPFVATLRDTQNYILAAEQGVGLFELPEAIAEAEIKHWKPLIKWLGDRPGVDNKLYPDKKRALI